MLFSINKYRKCLRLKTVLFPVSPAVLKSACLTQRFQLAHLSNWRAVPGKGGEYLLFILSSAKRCDRMEGGDATCGSGCKEKLPCKPLWWVNCSIQAFWDGQVGRGAASPSYRLDEESGFLCLQLDCSMLANPVLLSLGSELGGGSRCCNLTG